MLQYFGEGSAYAAAAALLVGGAAIIGRYRPPERDIASSVPPGARADGHHHEGRQEL
jgi:hypothetical protein